ncbi:hypothetical protein BD414DRAFT_206188 [Trametes punicea]|nr:hypothetical protein BD414DRAFT_206188 [Trametes punicea]
MLYTISQVFGGSQDLRTALRAVATAFAIDSLPLPYGVEDHNEDGPNEDAENHDESIILNNTPGVDRYDAERDEPSLPVSELPFEDNAVETSLDIDENTDPTRHAIFNSDLDPTIPEFVPSHQLRLQPLPRTPSPSPSHRLDRLRPLPQGPNPLFHDEQDVQAGTESRDFHDLDALPEVEEYQWPVDPIISERFQDFLRELGDRPGRTPEHLNVGGQVDSPLHLASLLRDSPATQGDSPDVAPSSSDITSPTPSSEQHLITPADTQEAASESVFVQDCEPPFLTDGRGRVVWSNTTSSRGRESRRGRAVSSSAMRLPHAKSNSDVLLPNDCCDGASCHHSPVQSSSGLPQPRLVRQWSFPSVATGSALEEARSAEFLTDGRGRVVFAANKQSH